MYPNVYFLLKKLFNIEAKWSFLLNTFGLFVAVAFLFGLRILYYELKRKRKEGYFNYTEKKELVGKNATIQEIMVQFFVGFIVGFKLLGIFQYSYYLNSTDIFNPVKFIFSNNGNIYGGLILGTILAYIRWFDKNKKKLPKPKTIVFKIYPENRVNDILLLGFVFGFIGAKIFHHLENWSDFVKDPLGNLTSMGGLTFYGGLIFAGISILVYAKINKIPILHLLDSFAPVLMISYAIGRFGCHFSGDGDWGVLNSAYISDINGNVVSATMDNFNQALINNTMYYKYSFGDLSNVPFINFKADVLPSWMVAQNFPNNVLSEGFRFSDCEGIYCSYLPVPVFPTSLYEGLAGLLLFGILWWLRKKLKYVGQLFGIYLIFNGLERFLIEKIRINSVYNLGFISFTQAELISSLLVIGGIYFLFKVQHKKLPLKKWN